MKNTPWKQYAARRRINIRRWLDSQDIRTYKKLVNHCTAIGVEAPALEELNLQGILLPDCKIVTPDPEPEPAPPLEMQDVTVSAESAEEVEQLASEAEPPEPTAPSPDVVDAGTSPRRGQQAFHSSSQDTVKIHTSGPSAPPGLKVDGDGFLVVADGEDEGE